MTTVSSRSTVAHLPPPTHGIRLRMTYEDYLAWAPESMVAEWADGEATVAMPATHLHQRVIGFLFQLLQFYVTEKGLGTVLMGPMEVKLWPVTGPAREPDIFVVRTEHQDRFEPKRLAGAPDLAVEVISGDSVGRDRETKHREYSQAGVPEYWVIEPRQGARRQPSVTVYHLDAGGDYGPAEAVPSGVVQSAVVPGFWVRAEWLWEMSLPPSAVLQEILRYPQGPDSPPAPDGLAVLPWAGALLQQGRTEGEAAGMRTSLRKILHSRFGAIPDALEQRISTADLATLDTLTTHALQAQHLADLL